MKRLAVTALTISAHAAFAATNGLDTNFGSGGALLIGPTPQSGLVITRITAVTPLSDGKILVGGFSVGSDGAHPDAELAVVGRLNAEGTWDTAFADHGMFVLPYGITAAPLGGEIHHIVTASDGSALAVGGSFKDSEYLGMHTCTLVVKLTGNGALQTDFGGTGAGAFCFDFAPEPPNGGTVKGHFEDVSTESDDGFLLTTGLTNMDQGAIARFVANGTLDPSFGNAGVADVPFRSWQFARQADGNTLVVGGNDSICVERIDHAGKVDPVYGTAGLLSFDTYSDGTSTNTISAKLDAQDRLTISDVDIGPGFFAPYQLGRIDSAGTLDVTFNGSQQQPGIPGFVSLPIPIDSYDGIADAFPLADGHTLALGNGSTSSNSTLSFFILAARLNADASFDSSFGDTDHPGWAKIVLGSNSLGSGMRVAASDSAGRVLVSTNITDDGNTSCAALIRFTPDRVFGAGFDGPAPLICPD